MRPSEKKTVENPVLKWVKQRGIVATKGNTWGRNSWPDRIFWLTGGRPAFIEFKAAGEEPTDGQAKVMDALKDKGYDVAWFDNKEDSIAWLEALLVEPEYREQEQHARVQNAEIARGQVPCWVGAAVRDARDKVGAARVPKARGKVAAGTRGRSVAVRSRTGQNKHSPRSNQDS